MSPSFVCSDILEVREGKILGVLLGKIYFRLGEGGGV